jgi:hypothetical protein
MSLFYQKYTIMPVMKIKHFLLKKLSFFILFIFIFTGCADSIQSTFGDSGTYKKGSEDTSVRYIVHKNETVALINASYLNNMDTIAYDKKYHNFLVGLYLANDQKIDLENKELFFIKLNKKPYESYKVVKKNSDIYKKIPLLNPYAQYFIISFANNDETNLNLAYKYATYNKVSLPFVVD